MQGRSRNTPRAEGSEFPLVSAGMAIYNSAATLERALDSLLAQDYPNLEVVICEDCSTDGSRELCERHARKDQRIRLHLNERNLGFETNYLQVVQKSRGEFFFWADGDDIHRSAFAATLVRALQRHPEAAVAQGCVECRYDDGELIDVMCFTGGHDPTGMGPLERTRYFVTTRTSLRDLKHNYFQMGLFRRALLLPALEGFSWTLGERALLASLSLDHGFVAVDETLLVAHRHRVSAVERYPQVASLQKRQGQTILRHRLDLLKHLRTPGRISSRARLLWLPLLALAWMTERKARKEICQAISRMLRERCARLWCFFAVC